MISAIKSASKENENCRFSIQGMIINSNTPVKNLVSTFKNISKISVLLKLEILIHFEMMSVKFSLYLGW